MLKRKAQSTDLASMYYASMTAFHLALLVSCLVVFAWVIDWRMMQSLLAGLPTMKMNTALSLAFLAAAGIAGLRSTVYPGYRQWVIWLTIPAFVLSLGNLCESCLGIDLKIDTLFALDPASQENQESPGRMSFGTSIALSLLVFGTLLHNGRSKYAGPALTTLAGCMGIVSMMLFVMNARLTILESIFATTAIHTATLICLISGGLLLSYACAFKCQRLDSEGWRSQLRQARPMCLSVAVILLCGLTVTSMVTLDAQQDILDSQETKFKHLTERLVNETQRCVHQPVYGLHGARGVYYASKSVERGEFKAYVDSRDLPGEFPGAKAFGFAERVNRENLREFITAQRADEAPGFEVQEIGNLAELFIVKFIYPVKDNFALWGKDLGEDPVLREAIHRVIVTGQPTISGRVKLEQACDSNDGFLLLVPVYAKGPLPTTQRQRREKLYGLLFAPMILSDALANAVHAANGYLDFEVFDGVTLKKSSQLFDYDRHLDNVAGKINAEDYSGRTFHAQTPIWIGGRRWTISTSTSPKFEAEIDRHTPALIGLGGFFLSILVSIIFWALGLGRARAVAMAEEMTRELRKSEQATRAAAERAELANKAKSEFLANMSHEIRTPMTAILGYADVLLEDEVKLQSPEARRNALNTIKGNGEQLLTIINDILDMSKIEAGKMDVEKIETTLFSIVDDVLSLLSNQAKAKGITLQAEYTSSIPAKIFTDPTRLRQILLNLAGNALKFTESGSVTLYVSCLQVGNKNAKLQIKVVDTGIGMSSEQVKLIRKFSAFSQADTSTSRKFGGSGLGLRICKALSTKLGGDIELHSEPGVGSTFTLTIDPGDISAHHMLSQNEIESWRKNRVAATSQQISQFPPDLLEGMRILLAEDGPANQRLFSFVLKKVGAEVEIVENGKLAVQRLTADGTVEGELMENPPFDVILMDMQMPEMDGYTAATHLRDKGIQVPIVALTANAMSGEREKCIAAGCTEYATKPIDRKALFGVLSQFMAQLSA